MNAKGVVLFHTTSMAFRAESCLLRAGLSVKLIPTPRNLSSDCGIALRFDWPDRAEVDAALQHAGVETAGLHLHDGHG